MTRKLTFCSLMSVLGIICLVLSNILQTNTIFLYLLSSVFTYISTEEYGIKHGLLTYGVISLVAFMLVADKVSIGAYAMVVGYYPVVKHIIDHFNLNRYLKWLLKIFFAASVATIAVFMLKTYLPADMNFKILYPAGIAVFVIYDIMLDMAIKFYVLRLRKFKR